MCTYTRLQPTDVELQVLLAGHLVFAHWTHSFLRVPRYFLFERSLLSLSFFTLIVAPFSPVVKLFLHVLHGDFPQCGKPLFSFTTRVQKRSLSSAGPVTVEQAGSLLPGNRPVTFILGMGNPVRNRPGHGNRPRGPRRSSGRPPPSPPR